MKISKYFDTDIDVKILNGNIPTDEQIKNITIVCEFLDEVREKFGVITVTSGLRSNKKQQELIKKGVGATKSGHLDGNCIDFVPKKAKLDDVFEYVYSTLLHKVDKIIIERDKDGNRWLHVGVKESGNRHEAYRADWDYEKNTMKYVLIKKIY